jgi:branched-chain amino acid transport system permease protein
VTAVVVTVTAPYLVSEPNLPMLTLLPLFGIVAVSLVILTGWAGQISLGQFGLVGIGAAVAGGLASEHNIDFFAALFLGIAAGAVVAVIIGLPAIRIQGLYLAVTTLAFGYAMENFVLNKRFFIGRVLLPEGYQAGIVRPLLYGRWDLESDRAFYFTCVVALALAMGAALAFRNNRSGRVLIAVRDNQRAAASYGLSPVRVRLAAFAVSGGIAGLAGTLMAYQQHNVIPGTYNALASIVIFLAASIAGLTSVWASVIGVMLFYVIVLFGPLLWYSWGDEFGVVIPLLITGPLLILNLYRNPGGLAAMAFEQRDRFLRRIAERHGIHVPSLIADSRQDDDAQVEPDFALAAAQTDATVEIGR